MFEILITMILLGSVFLFSALHFRLPFLLVFAGIVFFLMGASLLMSGQGVVKANFNETQINNNTKLILYDGINIEYQKDTFSTITGIVLLLIGLAFSLEGASIKFKGSSLIR